MCLAIPGKILKINGETATVDFNGIKKKINISLVDAIENDYVLVHAGFAIEKFKKEEALESLKLFNNE